MKSINAIIVYTVLFGMLRKSIGVEELTRENEVGKITFHNGYYYRWRNLNFDRRVVSNNVCLEERL